MALVVSMSSTRRRDLINAHGYPIHRPGITQFVPQFGDFLEEEKMLHFPCVSLSNLSKMFGEKNDMRSKMIGRSFSNPDLLAIENEIIRINKLITSHRRRCRHCKLRENRAAFIPIPAPQRF